MAAAEETSLSVEELKRQLEEKGLATGGNKVDLFYRLHTPRFQHLKVKKGFQTATFKQKTVFAKLLDERTGFSVFYYPPIRHQLADPALYFSNKVRFPNTSGKGRTAAGKRPREEAQDEGNFSGTRSNTKPQTTSDQRFAGTCVLILVAKDHEYKVAKETIDVYGREWEKTEESSFGRGLYTCYSYSNVTLVLACAYCYGRYAVSIFGRFLRKFDPDFVSTVGCCAGMKPKLRSEVPVYLITEAVSQGSGITYYSDPHHTAMDMYRNLNESRYVKFIGRPDADTRSPRDTCRILSVASGTVDDSSQLDEMLSTYGSSCLDMEVFFFFELVRNENRSRKEDGKREITLLPALKGYSDHADKEERDKNLYRAVKNATFACINMVGYLV
eukprot:gb/GECG01008593.1/.p1 GENE.gb/GECG01008593.1/~~gb/GECG01008593.1/.p1  ORF type:complete len:386 (+),score=42.18 gb/GECG01008593.1/:1-1158(+)